MPRAQSNARQCAACGVAAEHPIGRRRRGQQAWMCTPHWQILLELRKGRVRRAVDAAAFRWRRRAQ